MEERIKRLEYAVGQLLWAIDRVLDRHPPADPRVHDITEEAKRILLDREDN